MKKIVSMLIAVLMLASLASLIACTSTGGSNLDDIASLPSTSDKYMHTDTTGTKYSFSYAKTEGDTAQITGFTGDATIQYVEVPDAISVSEDSSRPVTSIGTSAFISSTSVKFIDLPSTVEYIGAYAFARCEALESIVIPESVKYIDEFAFEGCKSLKTVIFARSNALDDDGNVTDKLITKCTEIKKCAFASCDSLETIITAKVNYTKSGNSFSREKLGNKIYTLSDKESTVEGVVLPESVVTIGEGAFLGCGSIKNLVIGNNIIAIGREAFYLCTKLENVTFPTSKALTEDCMGKYMFSQSVKPVLLKTSAGTVFEKYVADMVYIEEDTTAEETTVAE